MRLEVGDFMGSGSCAMMVIEDRFVEVDQMLREEAKVVKDESSGGVGWREEKVRRK